MRGLGSGTPRKNRLRITTEMLCTAFQLAGDQGRARTYPIIEHLQQIIALRRAHGRNRKVINDQQIKLGQLGESASEAAITMGHMQFIKQPPGAHIQHREADSGGLMCQGTAKPRLATPGRTRDILPVNSLCARCRFTIPTTPASGQSYLSSGKCVLAMNAT